MPLYPLLFDLLFIRGMHIMARCKNAGNRKVCMEDPQKRAWL
jgi:hypothetical protein